MQRASIALTHLTRGGSVFSPAINGDIVVIATSHPKEFIVYDWAKSAMMRLVPPSTVSFLASVSAIPAHAGA